MKKIIVITLLLGTVLVFTGCSFQNNEGEDCLLTIILFSREYISENKPIDKLPEGYDYVGTLSEEMANNTGLAGCKMYINKNLNSIDHVYIYQESEILNSVDTDGSSRTQWAYVKWVLR